MGELKGSGGGKVGNPARADDLAAIGARRPGSEAERRAARQIEQRLHELGRDATLEPTRVRPNFGLTHLIHAVAGIVGSVLAVYMPLVGLAVVAVTAISTFGDLTGSYQLVRLLTPVRASQNIVSDERGDKPGLIVLTAQYDSPLGGMLSGPRLKSWPRIFLGSLVLIAICAVARLVGLSATWLTIVQFLPTVVLIASTPLFADAALAAPTDEPGPEEGVAAALRLAGSHAERLNHFDLMVVFTGASAQYALGMRAWLKRHRRELEPQATAVISLDNFAADPPECMTKDGPVLPARMHPTLVELARECGAEAAESRAFSDAYMARSAGLPALRISASRDSSLVGDLLERIDEEIGPLLG